MYTIQKLLIASKIQVLWFYNEVVEVVNVIVVAATLIIAVSFAVKVLK